MVWPETVLTHEALALLTPLSLEGATHVKMPHITYTGSRGLELGLARGGLDARVGREVVVEDVPDDDACAAPPLRAHNLWNLQGS